MGTIKMETIKSTFDTTTVEGMTKMFNASNGASTSLKQAIGEVLEVQDILIYSDMIQGFGGAEAHESELVAIFTVDGNTYAGVSAVATKAASSLADMMNKNEEISPKITVVKGSSKGGQEFVNLQLISL